MLDILLHGVSTCNYKRVVPQTAGLSHLAVAKHSHTAHVSLTVHYPHHPFYGQTVTVVRRSVSFGPHQVQVALSSAISS
jgi:hypothetical protein